MNPLKEIDLVNLSMMTGWHTICKFDLREGYRSVECQPLDASIWVPAGGTFSGDHCDSSICTIRGF